MLYIYMYTRFCMCVCVCIHVYICMTIHFHVRVRMCFYMYPADGCAWLSQQNMPTYVFIYKFLCINMYMYTYRCKYI